MPVIANRRESGLLKLFDYLVDYRRLPLLPVADRKSQTDITEV